MPQRGDYTIRLDKTIKAVVCGHRPLRTPRVLNVSAEIGYNKLNSLTVIW